MNVTLRRLEVFVAVTDTGSFSRAANRLNIAQPSVSAHIRGLEREVGGTVFERRRGSRPVLTDLGRSVREHARPLLAEADDLRADVVNIRSAGGQRLVLSCQRSLANFALKDQITHFALTRPDIQLTVRIGRQEDVVSDVRDGIADIGCFLSNEEMRGLISQVIGTQRLCLVAAPGHPLAKQRRVTPAMIAEYGFVGPPPGSLFGRAVARLLGDIGIREIRMAAQATEYQFLRELVAAGVGISCSLEKNLENDIANGVLKKIDIGTKNLMLDIRLISSQSRPQSNPMVELTDYLRSCAPKLKARPAAL
jgi:LysR family transcriptional regulator, low CO2-responsive transcriptional regulator